MKVFNVRVSFQGSYLTRIMAADEDQALRIARSQADVDEAPDLDFDIELESED